jgi:hypothetical protein
MSSALQAWPATRSDSQFFVYFLMAIKSGHPLWKVKVNHDKYWEKNLLLSLDTDFLKVKTDIHVI